MGNQVSVVDALVNLEFPPGAVSPADLPARHDLPMGVLAFEVASLMRRALDLWRQLDARNITGLEKKLQTEGLKRLGVGDYSFRWRLAGAEYASDLTALTAAVGVLARRMGGARGGEVLKRLKGYSRAWKREDSFSEGEADELMRFLRDQLEPMGALHKEMLTLDDVINSTGAEPDVPPPKGRRAKGKPQGAVLDQIQVVHHLQRASLWTHPLERPVLILAVALGMLWQQYRTVFGRPSPPKQEELSATLGAAGLPTLYARVLLGIEQMQEMSPTSPPFKEQRRELYGILPSAVRRRLAKRLKQRSKRQVDGAIAKDLRGVVGDILRWAVPVAERTEVWNGDKSFGAQRRTRLHRTLLVETLHYCDKDKFEAVLVELLASFSLVTLHARRTPPHPHSKARPASAPLRRKLPGSAGPKNQAARPTSAPAYPASASAPAPAFPTSASAAAYPTSASAAAYPTSASGASAAAYPSSASTAAAADTDNSSNRNAKPKSAPGAPSPSHPPARTAPMARSISITDAPDGGIRHLRNARSPRSAAASRSPHSAAPSPAPPSDSQPFPASRSTSQGPPSMARSPSNAPPPMARTASEPGNNGPAMPGSSSHARPGPGPAPGPAGPRGNPTGPRPRPGAGPGPRPSPGQALPGRGGMGPGTGVPPGSGAMRAGPAGPQARPGPQARGGGMAPRPMLGPRPVGQGGSPAGGVGGGRGGGGRGGGGRGNGGPVYRPSPTSPALDDIDGMPIRRSGGNVDAGQRQKMQQREWLKREVLQQGGSHAMG
ncbi:hypothetical protein CLOM_g14312 [Closterium sp. NIES-68]|nr:hypothetical protein CLOM_g14312 [Closterium sp. NIES-68]GJP61704.1 hypothetical protein CLOP_g18848 [Closterium sp. NIES-67]